MLGDAELQRFTETGILRLPGAFRAEDAQAMEEMIWRFAAARGFVRTDPSTWGAGAIPGLSPKMKRKATFQLGWTRAVTNAVDQLLDGDWDRPSHCGALLVTFPDSTHWQVPRRIWHADTHFAYEPDPLFGIKTYGFINSVVAGQGGTCVISGSHHLVRRFARANVDVVRSLGHLPPFMKSDPWLVDLQRGPGDPTRTKRLLSPSQIDGHEIRVVELTGNPGDVVLTHPWTLHCIAPNASDRPRMMMSKNIWRRGVDQVLPVQ
jgi:Phytanoyl-CoA dioxygenase (PhyH)